VVLQKWYCKFINDDIISIYTEKLVIYNTISRLENYLHSQNIKYEVLSGLVFLNVPDFNEAIQIRSDLMIKFDDLNIELNRINDLIRPK
jgi:hypothetical protein